MDTTFGIQIGYKLFQLGYRASVKIASSVDSLSMTDEEVSLFQLLSCLAFLSRSEPLQLLVYIYTVFRSIPNVPLMK